MTGEMGEVPRGLSPAAWQPPCTLAAPHPISPHHIQDGRLAHGADGPRLALPLDRQRGVPGHQEVALGHRNQAGHETHQVVVHVPGVPLRGTGFGAWFQARVGAHSGKRRSPAWQSSCDSFLLSMRDNQLCNTLPMRPANVRCRGPALTRVVVEAAMTVDTRELTCAKEGFSMCRRSTAMRLRAVLSSTATASALRARRCGGGGGTWWKQGRSRQAAARCEVRRFDLRGARPAPSHRYM